MLKKDKIFLSKFEKIILETMGESNYSLEYVCNSMLLSRSQVHRRIKKITGMSTTKYIRKIRLEQAKELLKTKKHKISEIATIVGINSSQNFSKYFKQAYGLTPNAYRKSMRNKKR